MFSKILIHIYLGVFIDKIENCCSTSPLKGCINMPAQTLSDKAYEFIKNKIITCEYPPNSMINETMICEAINSSRTPVREAINKLEQDNLVRVIPKKGIIIKDVTLNDIKLIFETRILIETYSLRTYAKEMDLDYLREFKATLLANTELQTFFDMDDAFHSYIVAQTKNIYLINTSRSISDHNMRLRVLSGKSVEKRVEVTTSEHTEIIDHLINGEVERAVDALVDHLEKAKEASYISMLKSYDLSLTAQI